MPAGSTAGGLGSSWSAGDAHRDRAGYLPQGFFEQIEGGNPYPRLIQKTPRKPLRIFLHTVSRDANWDEPQNNFFSENLQVAAALAERGYDFRLVVGDGAHDGNHSGVILPDALRWLWRPTNA